MESRNSHLRRRVNWRHDIEGQTHLRAHLPGVIHYDFLPSCSFICKGRTRSSASTIQAENQLKATELVFSLIQFIASILRLLLAHLKENRILNVNSNVDASIFPVAFALVGVVFIFKSDEMIASSLQESYQQPVELDLIGTFTRSQNSPSTSSNIMPMSLIDIPLPNLQVHGDTSSEIEDNLSIGSPQRQMQRIEDSPVSINCDEPSSTTVTEESLTDNQNHDRVSSLRMRINVTSKINNQDRPSEEKDAVNNHEEQVDDWNELQKLEDNPSNENTFLQPYDYRHQHVEEKHAVSKQEKHEDYEYDSQEDYENDSQIIEVHMADTDFRKRLDLRKVTGYVHLYKKLREIFNIDVYSQDGKWILIYEDFKGDVMFVGNDSWSLFAEKVRKIYIDDEDKLGNSKKMK